MKKSLIMLVICCCISLQSNAGVLLFPKEKCPKDIICQENEILGNDGKCYSCDSTETIGIECIGYEKVQEICPNRAFGVLLLDSYLNCPEYQEWYNYEGKNYCVTKCDDGYERISPSACYNKITETTSITEY